MRNLIGGLEINVGRKVNCCSVHTYYIDIRTFFFVWGMCYTGCVKDEAMNGKELVNRQTFGAAYISCHFLEY